MSAFAPLAKSYRAPLEISGLEAATRRALDEYTRLDRNWSPSVAMVANVFRAMYASALPVDQIEKIGCAMHGISSWNAQPALTEMVRDGVLRSRMSGGRRLYEMNY